MRNWNLKRQPSRNSVKMSIAPHKIYIDLTRKLTIIYLTSRSLGPEKKNSFNFLTWTESKKFMNLQSLLLSVQLPMNFHKSLQTMKTNRKKRWTRSWKVGGRLEKTATLTQKRASRVASSSRKEGQRCRRDNDLFFKSTPAELVWHYIILLVDKFMDFKTHLRSD